MGKLFNTSIILANTYGPNWDNAQFSLKIFFSTLPDLNSYKLILGGDFNCVLNAQLDTSSVRSNNTLSSAAVAVNSFLRCYGLSDPWRIKNPTTKQFSFSPVHHSYSRIDYFIVDNQLLPLISNCKYHSIVLSDHSPVQMDLIFPANVAPQRTWRLDPQLLLCRHFRTYLNDQIDFFLEINDTQDVSRGVLWESMKAYLRDQVISYVAHRNKECSDKIADIDRHYALLPTPDLFKEKLLLQTEFNTLMTCKVEINILKSKQVYYEDGDKAGRLLALQLK